MHNPWAWLEFFDRFAFVLTLQDKSGPLEGTSGFQMMFVGRYDDGINGFIASDAVGHLYPEFADGK